VMLWNASRQGCSTDSAPLLMHLNLVSCVARSLLFVSSAFVSSMSRVCVRYDTIVNTWPDSRYFEPSGVLERSKRLVAAVFDFRKRGDVSITGIYNERR
jgi:hypothetical protein